MENKILREEAEKLNKEVLIKFILLLQSNFDEVKSHLENTERQNEATG